MREHLLFGLTAGRPRGSLVWQTPEDRLFHTYIIGSTGTGKTTLLKSLLLQNAQQHAGFVLLDPHGDLAEELSQQLPHERVIYWDVTNAGNGISFNPLKRVPADYRTLAASGLLEALMHRWEKAWGNSQEHILRNCFLALLDTPKAQLSEVLRLLDDDTFRASVLAQVTNPRVLDFWNKEYAAYPHRQRLEAIKPIQTKIGAFLADPLMQQLFDGGKQSISFRQAMDAGKIVIINLAKGRLGSDTSGLLGALIVSTLGLAAFSRADVAEGERRPFFIYADEFQNFATKSFEIMLSELRKYKVGLVLANQYLGQLTPGLRDAVMGNCGTVIAFRLGATDASFVAREFSPEFDALDLTRSPNYRATMKLMVQGAPTKPFSLATLQTQDAMTVSRNPFR